MLDIKLKLRAGHTSSRVWMDSSPLKTLFWNVTYACNFRCGICFADAGPKSPDELTTAEGMELVQKAHEAGVQDILISGGEPFMRKDLILILARMADSGITARIASNGSVLDDKILAQLRQQTLAKSFQISLDTADEALYAEFHGTAPTTLRVVLDNIKRIQDNGFHTTISVRLGRQTLEGIPQLLDLAVREGWATVTVHCPVHTRRMQGAFPQDEDVISLLSPALDHFCALPSSWLIETYIPWAEYHPLLGCIGNRIRINHRGCRAGRDRLTINPTGWILPCVCLDVPAAYVGNIRRDDLREVFQSSSLCEMMRRPEDYNICSDCPSVAKCGGGCRAAAFALTGRLDGPDGSCPVNKNRTKIRARESHTI